MAARIVVALLLVGVFAGAFFVYSILSDAQENTYTASLFAERDTQGMFAYYLSGQPLAAQRPVIGNPDAGLSFVIVVDFDNNRVEEFFEDTVRTLYPLLTRGEAKAIYKYIVSARDMEEKTTRFIKSVSALCVMEQVDDTVRLHQQLLHADSPLKAVNLTQEEFDSCVKQHQLLLAQDSAETESFRIFSPQLHVGVDFSQSTALTGFFSQQRLQQVIREQQIRMGI